MFTNVEYSDRFEWKSALNRTFIKVFTCILTFIIDYN